MNDQKTERDQRADRLRAALRENLRRRKAQAKGKSGGLSKARREISGDNSVRSEASPNSAGFAADKLKD